MVAICTSIESNEPDWAYFMTLFQDNPSIFFTEDGILINKKINTPISSFKKKLAELNITTINAFHLLDSTVVLNCELASSDKNFNELDYEVLSVKPYLSTISSNLQELVLKGYHWLQWDIQSKFCGKCGHPLKSMIKTTEKKCTMCKCSFFPRFSPAIIVLVKNKNQILLARSPKFPMEVYSAIAGFVDIGETAEMAIKHELREEVGIEVKNITYVGSQTWPFPDSFMIAFKADYLSGNITLDKKEIEDAQWFNVDTLPTLPERASISRKLIDFVLNEMSMR
ncbi:MAG: NAD(+) diphosphatase [Rickettsia endosymbiont of Pseudomimeciton antennatum]|nr:NAD(+) diphosphatase [Rickettsia endosymbiont of Pseudomimeciton antennatum]